MLLLTIGIIAVAVAAILATFYFGDREKVKTLEGMLETHKNYENIYALQKDTIDKLMERQVELINFIDKNINERVVYTTKDMGYDNVAKLDKDIIDDEEELLDESQEIDASQLETSTKLEPIK